MPTLILQDGERHCDLHQDLICMSMASIPGSPWQEAAKGKAA